MVKRRKAKQEPMFSEPQYQKTDRQFLVRFEPAMLERIKDRARAIGLSTSAWVRLACVHALTFDVISPPPKR
jgi:predicted DNA binding CopG/RHH family protein